MPWTFLNTTNHPIHSISGLAVLAGAFLVTPVSAVVNIAYVPVGNPGNAADTADGDIYTPGVQRYGAVPYTYQIAKNETTIGQVNIRCPMIRAQGARMARKFLWRG